MYVKPAVKVGGCTMVIFPTERGLEQDEEEEGDVPQSDVEMNQALGVVLFHSAMPIKS